MMRPMGFAVPSFITNLYADFNADHVLRKYFFSLQVLVL